MSFCVCTSCFLSACGCVVFMCFCLGRDHHTTRLSQSPDAWNNLKCFYCVHLCWLAQLPAHWLLALLFPGPQTSFNPWQFCGISTNSYIQELEFPPTTLTCSPARVFLLCSTHTFPVPCVSPCLYPLYICLYSPGPCYYHMFFLRPPDIYLLRIYLVNKRIKVIKTTLLCTVELGPTPIC